jgi:adenylate cyclase
MPPIDKTRHIVHHAGMKWEIDVFHGENEGLLIAEVELEREDQPLEIPSWAGAEVSDDPRYYNSSLSRHPFRKW